MYTLCICYKFNPEKLADFQTYAEGEDGPISRSGGNIVGYFPSTDFAGSNNEAIGLIDFPSLAAYEDYRGRLAADPEHRENVARLQASGAEVAMTRSIMQRIRQA